MPATHIKICGLTRQEDIRMAVAAGVNAIGLVFFPESARHLDINQASELVRAIPPLVSAVGLFVDAERTFVESVLEAVPLSLIQFHGDEKSDYCESFARPYIKALRIKTGQHSQEGRTATAQSLRETIASHPKARGFLLDAMHDKLAGGTGVSFDWSLIPADCGRPIILAGGLRPDNVGRAIKAVSPYAVDVSSGVEVSPGIKSKALISKFVDAVNNV